jgi:hypothetical protein
VATAPGSRVSRVAERPVSDLRGVTRVLLVLAILTNPAFAQSNHLTIDAKDVATFAAGPQHANVSWVDIDSCGTVADLVPLRGLPANIEVSLGKSDCLTVERLDGIEHARILFAYAKVRDISALAKASQMYRLFLQNGPLSIASLVKHAPPMLGSLGLNLMKNTRADLQQLLASTVAARLWELSIYVDHVPSLAPLPKLRALSVQLALADTRRADLGFVRHAPNLKNLNVGGAETADLTPILQLAKLETLDVAGICRVDARALVSLTKLRWLAISPLVDESRKPVRSDLDVQRSNRWVGCSPKTP